MIIERVGDLVEALLRLDPHDRLDFEVETYDADDLKDVDEAKFVDLDRNYRGHVQITLSIR